ncbi:hypothetical protein C8P66_12840 [Humitalea rosea]|uniref:Uncharacterized protein n=1 Tax=Humitalea rosea TaxID=990373 RepID=A0A2W7HXR4_9PROT|nr:hypothetical protein C8P66_12840 [Humitalea rosea]
MSGSRSASEARNAPRRRVEPAWTAAITAVVAGRISTRTPRGRSRVRTAMAGPKAGTWFDHEANTGGGGVDLIKRELRLEPGEVAERLQREVGMERPAARPHPSPSDHASPGDFTYPTLMAWEGAYGVVPTVCDGTVVSPEFPVFAVNTDRIMPDILTVHFSDPRTWERLSGASTGTNARRRRLHPNNLLAYEIPVPSLRVQRLIRGSGLAVEGFATTASQPSPGGTTSIAMTPSLIDAERRHGTAPRGERSAMPSGL